MTEVLADSGSRLESIAWLADQAASEIDIEDLQAEETEAKRLNELGLLPTIGCEVEVTWSSLFPELATKYFGAKDQYGRFERPFKDLSPEDQAQLNAESAVLEADIQPRYKATAEAGIPAGSDAYWEFANAPTYYWRTLAVENNLLFQNGLIPEGNDHSFHITLGGVSIKGGGMSLVLSGLELAHVSPDRIMAAASDGRPGYDSAWARRGEDGLRERDSSVLELGQSDGVELRTFTVNSAQQSRNLLRDAQMLTTVLLAYRHRRQLFSSNSDLTNLTRMWPNYVLQINNVWREAALPSESWGPPSLNRDKWQKWADCLARRDTENSVEARTVQYIRNIVSFAEKVTHQL